MDLRVTGTKVFKMRNITERYTLMELFTGEEENAGVEEMRVKESFEFL